LLKTKYKQYTEEILQKIKIKIAQESREAESIAYSQSFFVILDLGTHWERLVTEVFQTAAKLLMETIPSDR